MLTNAHTQKWLLSRQIYSTKKKIKDQFMGISVYAIFGQIYEQIHSG